MWRWFTIAALFYAGGHPAFDAYRPAAFERSLREFHRDVNRIGSDAIGTVGGLDQARALREFGALSGQFQAMLSRH